MKQRIITSTAVILASAEALLVLVSWLLSATMTGGVRSLLSSEGVRWFALHLSDMLLTPLLLWLLLASMAWGCLRHSGLLPGLATARTYREQLARRVAILTTAAYLALTALLVAVPHAVLLSATGRLWPSPFSAALLPLLCLGGIQAAVAYGLIARHFRSVADICQSFTDGLAAASPLLFIYVLAMQLWASLRFVFTF